MIFGLLQATNLFSYRKFEMDLNQPGLNWVRGNLLNSKCSTDNGSGKTTTPGRILTWILFGRTADAPAITGDNVVFEDAIDEGGYGSLKVWDDESMKTGFIVTRYQGMPNLRNSVDIFNLQYGLKGERITAPGITDNQELINLRLGMDFNTFVNSVIFGQGSVKRFTMATDAERKKIFDGALGIDYLGESQQRAKAKLLKVIYSINDGEIELTRLRSHAEDIRIQIARRIEEFNEEREKYGREGIELLANDVATKEHYISETVQLFIDSLGRSRAQEDKSKLVDFIGDIPTSVGDCEGYHGLTFAESEAELRIVSAQLDVTMELVSTLKKDLSDAKSSKCSACGQPIPKSLLDKRIKEITDNLSSAEDRITSLSDERKYLVDNSRTAEKLWSEIKGLHLRLHPGGSPPDRVGELESISEKLQGRVLAWSEAEKKLEERFNAISKVSSPISVFKMFVSLAQTELSIEQLEDSMVDLEIEKRHIEFWIQGFSNTGIKSLMLDSVVPFVNKKANEFSEILTGGEIYIELSTQSQTKKGEDRDKLSLVCRRTIGGNNYTKFSEGEKKRSDICISLALRELIGSRGSRPINFLILDEAFESLDGLGVERVVELIKHIEKKARTVFVITHNQDLQEHFGRVFVVEKSGKESILLGVGNETRGRKKEGQSR